MVVGGEDEVDGVVTGGAELVIGTVLDSEVVEGGGGDVIDEAGKSS